jgi:hypothetical protein
MGRLRGNFFGPAEVKNPETLGQLIKGSVLRPAGKVDLAFSEDVSFFLTKNQLTKNR